MSDALRPETSSPGFSPEVSPALRRLLTAFAPKYLWWKTPEEALAFPNRVMAQVMELGNYEDVFDLTETAGLPTLRKVIRNAEAGWFPPRSWHFWNYRLGLCGIGQAPPLPRKKIPFLGEKPPEQDEPATFTMITRGVKFSFFGGLSHGHYHPPELTADRALQVAALDRVDKTLGGHHHESANL